MSYFDWHKYIKICNSRKTLSLDQFPLLVSKLIIGTNSQVKAPVDSKFSNCSFAELVVVKV